MQFSPRRVNQQKSGPNPVKGSARKGNEIRYRALLVIGRGHHARRLQQYRNPPHFRVAEAMATDHNRTARVDAPQGEVTHADCGRYRVCTVSPARKTFPPVPR